MKRLLLLSVLLLFYCIGYSQDNNLTDSYSVLRGAVDGDMVIINSFDPSVLLRKMMNDTVVYISPRVYSKIKKTKWPYGIIENDSIIMHLIELDTTFRQCVIHPSLLVNGYLYYTDDEIESYREKEKDYKTLKYKLISPQKAYQRGIICNNDGLLIIEDAINQ